jgi:hypothetical protein
MAKVKIVIRTQCLQCDSIISACAECGTPFKDNQQIECKQDGLVHTCKVC